MLLLVVFGLVLGPFLPKESAQTVHSSAVELYEGQDNHVLAAKPDGAIGVSELVPKQEEKNSSEWKGLFQESKDYLEEARNNQKLYEELEVDPCSPSTFEKGGSMGATLKLLAEKNEKFRYLYEHQNSYPWGLLAATCNYPEMIDFTLDYPIHDIEEKAYTAEEMEQDFPLFLQWDRRWGYLPYGAHCIAMSGCAPTCLTMVAVALTRDENITPDVVGEYSMKKGYYLPGTGTKWALLTKGADYFGVHANEVKMEKELVTEKLQAGLPVICSMKEGNFTARGHFIVLVGVDEDGKMIVNDPNSLARSQMRWDFNTIRGQAKNMWYYTLSDVGDAIEELEIQ